jgi:hypothetical protein
VDKIGNSEGEQEFVAKMFELDQKNYHVWSYRQWLVKRFELWDAGEIEAIEQMLKTDVRNNSAWNHRWFVSFGRDPKTFEDKQLVRRELEYVYFYVVSFLLLIHFTGSLNQLSDGRPRINRHGITSVASSDKPTAQPPSPSRPSRPSPLNSPPSMSPTLSVQVMLWIFSPTYTPVRMTSAKKQ